MENNKATQKDIVSKYSIADNDMVVRLKKIKAIQPTWFNRLRMGQSIFLNNEDMNGTRSIRKLYDICVKQEKESMVKDDTNKENMTDEENSDNDKLALAYQEMSPLADLVASHIKGNEIKLYAFKEKLDSALDIENRDTTSIRESEVKRLKASNDLLRKQVAELHMEIRIQKESFSEMISSLPKNRKTVKAMRKL